MYKYATRWLCAIVLLVSAATASASFHLWQLQEIYSNADGTVQFIELKTNAGGQQFLAGHMVTSSQGATTHSFTFPSTLPGDSAGRTFLIGTVGFAALGLVAPDYVVPNGFLFTTNGNVDFAGVDSVSWTALPVDGVMSINRSLATAVNSPKNFAGATGSVLASPSPGDLIVYLEEPINGGTASGVSNIRGWAVSLHPIQRIDLYIDGSPTFTLPYGGTRPDVGAAFPAYPGSVNSGFSMAYAYGVLSAGSHTFLARAVDNLGNVRDSAATFNVVRLPSSFISNPAEVNLQGAGTTIVDGNTLRLTNVTVQGVPYTLTLRWNTATQGFVLEAADPH